MADLHQQELLVPLTTTANQEQQYQATMTTHHTYDGNNARKRKQRSKIGEADCMEEEEEEEEEDKEYSFYAIRPGSKSKIKKPVIFFGWNDFQNYLFRMKKDDDDDDDLEEISTTTTMTMTTASIQQRQKKIRKIGMQNTQLPPPTTICPFIPPPPPPSPAPRTQPRPTTYKKCNNIFDAYRFVVSSSSTTICGTRRDDDDVIQDHMSRKNQEEGLELLRGLDYSWCTRGATSTGNFNSSYTNDGGSGMMLPRPSQLSPPPEAQAFQDDVRRGFSSSWSNENNKFYNKSDNNTTSPWRRHSSILTPAAPAVATFNFNNTNHPQQQEQQQQQQQQQNEPVQPVATFNFNNTNHPQQQQQNDSFPTSASAAPPQPPIMKLIPPPMAGQQQQQMTAASNNSCSTLNKRHSSAPHAMKKSPQRRKRTVIEQLEQDIHKWEEQFQLLKQFKDEYGHCIVPKTYDKNKMKSFPTKYKPLIGWLSKQLEYLIEFDKLHPPSAPIFKSGCPQKNTMTPMRKSRLLEIGFYNMSDQERTKILNDAKWDTQYQLLQEYIKENGNLPYRVKQKGQERFKGLDNWVKKQRGELEEFNKNRDLYLSVHNHNSKTNSGNFKMTEERKQRLKEVGIHGEASDREKRQWRFEETFKKNYEALKAYKQEHGNLNIPKGSQHYNHYCWLLRMRKEYKALQEGEEVCLQDEHAAQLTNLGFNIGWSRQTRGEKMAEYVDFVKQYGRFPHSKSKDERESHLGANAGRWKIIYKHMMNGVSHHPKFGECVLPQDQIDALAAIGFKWKTGEVNSVKKSKVSWDDKFELLKAYKDKHGHCEPPIKHPKLGSFCAHERQQYRLFKDGMKSSLTMDRLRKLVDIGFRFNASDKRGHSRSSLDDQSGYDSSSFDDDDGDIDGDEGFGTLAVLRVKEGDYWFSTHR